MFGRKKQPKMPWPDYDEDTDMHKTWSYQPNLQAYVGGAHVSGPSVAPVATTMQSQPAVPTSYGAYISGSNPMAVDPAARLREAQMSMMAQQQYQQHIAQQQQYDKQHRQAMKQHLKAARIASGRRPWHATAGRAISTVATMTAVAVEVLFVLRDAAAKTSYHTPQPSFEDGSGVDSSEDASDSTDDVFRLMIRAVKNATVAANGSGIANGTFANATNPQWVIDTDVQNNVSGVAFAVTYHILTTAMLVILLLAELRLWRQTLHPSAMGTVGLVQLWAGLAISSRSFDVFGQATGYLLFVAGLGNLFFGITSRFLPGGPGMSLFRTGQAGVEDMTAQQLALVQSQAQALAAAASADAGDAVAQNVSEKPKKGDLAAPSPYEEEKEATATAERQAQQASQTAAPASHRQFVLPNPSTDTGYDAVPLLDQLARTNPFLQHQVLQAMSTPGGVTYDGPAAGALLTDDVAPKPIPAHLLDPYSQQHQPKKTWRPRFLGGGRKAAEEGGEV